MYGLCYEILGSHKINTMGFMAINRREGKPKKRKGLDTGKFGSCSRAKAVWECARLRQLYICARENKDAKSYLFAQCFSACTIKIQNKGPPNIAFTLRDMEVKPISGYLEKPMLQRGSLQSSLLHLWCAH